MSELPKGWEETSFGEVVRSVAINDKKLPRKQYATSGKFPVVDQGQEFIGGYSDEADRIVDEDLPLIVFGDHTRIFKFLERPFVPGADGIKILKPLGVDEKWLYHIAHALEFPNKGYARHFQHLKKARLLVPPLPEQHRIVTRIEELFSRLDAGVAALKQAKAQLQRYRQSVLAAAVTGELTLEWREAKKAEGRKQETGEELLERILKQRQEQWSGKGKYKEPEGTKLPSLPTLPANWNWATMEQLGLVIGGLTKNSKRNSHTTKLPYLRVANVYADELRLDEIKEIGVSESELDKLLVRKGDLLIVEGNGSKDQIGRLAIWNGSIEPCVHQNHLIKVRLIEPELGKFVVSWMLSPSGRPHIERVASSTSGLYTLSVGKVAKLPVPLPPQIEQHRIVAEVDARTTAIDHLEAELDRQITRSSRLRQSTLASAFSGRL